MAKFKVKIEAQCTVFAQHEYDVRDLARQAASDLEEALTEHGDWFQPEGSLAVSNISARSEAEEYRNGN